MDTNGLHKPSHNGQNGKFNIIGPTSLHTISLQYFEESWQLSIKTSNRRLCRKFCPWVLPPMLSCSGYPLSKLSSYPLQKRGKVREKGRKAGQQKCKVRKRRHKVKKEGNEARSKGNKQIRQGSKHRIQGVFKNGGGCGRCQTWRFPEMGVPPNHPFDFGMFREINHPAIGVSPLMKTSIFTYASLTNQITTMQDGAQPGQEGGRMRSAKGKRIDHHRQRHH